jgi:glycosyltransferase involved in cell wall biosynthesis
MPDQKIVALIPANNEADHIQQVVEAACRYLPVWVVDDGSRDATAVLAEAAGAQVIRQTPNQGKGAALLTGFRRCLVEDAGAVVMLDGDGQHDPAEIPLFLDAYAQQKDGMIIGQRDYARMPFPRNLTNTFGRWMISQALGQYVPDNQSGYRLLSRPLIEILLNNPEKGFELEVDMITLCLKHHLGLGWVPIRTIYADQKSHIRPLHHLVNYFRITYKAWRTMKNK